MFVDVNIKHNAHVMSLNEPFPILEVDQLTIPSMPKINKWSSMMPLENFETLEL